MSLDDSKTSCLNFKILEKHSLPSFILALSEDFFSFSEAYILMFALRMKKDGVDRLFVFIFAILHLCRNLL